MKKTIFVVLSLLIVAVFLVGCAEKELTTEEEKALETELEQLSDEELDQVIEEGESEDTKALAGQAYKKVSVGRYNYKPSTALRTAYKVKANRYTQPKLAIDPKSLILIKNFADPYCAEHFVKIDASEMPMCGGGSMGGDPITDAYGCRADQNYPPANSCPEGMQMNNVYGYAAGNTPTYSCYVPQEIGSGSAPEGCPINPADVECASGFVYDATSNLGWNGGGSSWGCSFRCKAQPDPYDSNEDWPCVKDGFKPIGGGGGDTCCAKW